MGKVRTVLYAALIIALCLSLCACGSEGGVSISDKDTEEALLEKGYACAYPEDGTEPDFDAARQYFEAAAESGSGEAANWLGDAYRDGIVLERDLALAYLWYERGSELGDMGAMNSLGSMLEDGVACVADPERASDLFLRAAELGNIWAYGNAARMYRDGIGVEQDTAKAAEWYERMLAENPEDIWGMAEYAHLLTYGYGDGIKPDIEKAAQLAVTALKGGDVWSAYTVTDITAADWAGYFYLQAFWREEDPGDLSQLTISSYSGEDDPRELAKLMVSSFKEIGDTDTMMHYCDILYDYYGNEYNNYLMALPAYTAILFDHELTATLDRADEVIYKCREMYLNDKGMFCPPVKSSLDGAILCECAANGVDISTGDVPDADYAAAMRNVAYDYYTGNDGALMNRNKALELFEQAGELGYAGAYRDLGQIFFEEDRDRAIGYFEKGAALGDADCAAELSGIQ